MTGDQSASLLYLGLLILVIGGSYIVSNRARLGQTLQQASIWALIFLGAVAVFGLWGDIRNSAVPVQRSLSATTVEVPRARDSHFYLTLDIAGTPVRFVVDTGATDIVLTSKDAERIGVNTADLVYLGRANTANGPVRTARVTLGEVRLGSIEDRDVPAWVNEGTMEDSLLGMSYLNRFTSLQIERDRLVLTR